MVVTKLKIYEFLEKENNEHELGICTFSPASSFFQYSDYFTRGHRIITYIQFLSLATSYVSQQKIVTFKLMESDTS